MAITNQIQWRGILPVQPLQNIQIHPGPFETSVAGSTRSQILKYKTVTFGETIIHTVTTGKTLFLTSCSISLFNTAPAYAYIRIRNASDVEVTRLLYVMCHLCASANNSKKFSMPISIAAGFDVTVYIEDGMSTASIEGWEE